jgi:hypothetical protein
MGIRDRLKDWDPEPARDSTPEELAALRGEANPRPTGKELFDSYTEAEQDAMLGPKVAQAVREGRVKFEDLVAEDGSFIRQATDTDLGL